MVQTASNDCWRKSEETGAKCKRCVHLMFLFVDSPLIYAKYELYLDLLSYAVDTWGFELITGKKCGDRFIVFQAEQKKLVHCHFAIYTHILISASYHCRRSQSQSMRVCSLRTKHRNSFAEHKQNNFNS